MNDETLILTHSTAMGVELLPIKPLHKKFVMPWKKHDSDVGYDVTATSMKIKVVDGTLYVSYGLGFGVDVGDEYGIYIAPRSSITKNTDLVLGNSVGIIDPDYKFEEIHAQFRVVPNLNFYRELALYSQAVSVADKAEVVVADLETLLLKTSRLYQVGERVGQMFLVNRYDLALMKSDYEISQRRGGLGSTGRFNA